MSGKLYQKDDKARVVPVDSRLDRNESYRTPWRRDYARLIHSAAFRRLQGKTQLFPSHESDFFRNRLSHSLEVAQIAKSIAIRINNTESFFKSRAMNIDTDLVETVALAHDLGHPPFGHNGEEALDECMKNSGGFEGNAQTLRILSKLEKRETKSYDHEQPLIVHLTKDNRAGLNLTYRTLAGVLKYDNKIPRQNEDRGNKAGVVKGYYYTEADLVESIKLNVCNCKNIPFKTIECSIMDIADDIAYSTYDLEDSFKAGFLSPLKMLSAKQDLARNVAKTVSDRLALYYPELSEKEKTFTSSEVYKLILDEFSYFFTIDDTYLDKIKEGDYNKTAAAAAIASNSEDYSEKLSKTGYYRTKFTSELVGSFINNIRVRVNKEIPALSRVYIDVETFKRIEVLKNFAYQSLIMSSMLKVTEYRGKEIIKKIYSALTNDNGHLLMPDDFRYLYQEIYEPDEKKRAVCDFIAGMTDRYAIQFYCRLYGNNPESIYSPL